MERIIKREIINLSTDTREKIVELLKKEELPIGSNLHCFVEWLNFKEAEIICIRQ